MPSFRRQEDTQMARTNETAELFQKAYDKSKDLIGTVKHESRAAYDEARRWVPEHPTAVAVTATAALSVGLLGFALGRRRRARERGIVSAAVARAPQLNLTRFFRIASLWMLYRIATRD
jgi:ElaB/YqjD/DUF883 family membrane-anchored ribosome-binding protein